MHCDDDHLDVALTVVITLDTHHRLKCLVSVVAFIHTGLFIAVNIDYSPSTVIICYNSEISCATFSWEHFALCYVFVCVCVQGVL